MPARPVRPVAQADNSSGIKRTEQFLGLRDADFSGFAVYHLVLGAPDGREGIKGDGMARHQRVEKMPQESGIIPDRSKTRLPVMRWAHRIIVWVNNVALHG